MVQKSIIHPRPKSKPLAQMNHSKTLSLLAACLALPAASHAQAIWNGSVSSDYGTAANWSTGVAPGTGVDVVIDSNATNPTVIPNGNWDRRGAGTTTIDGTGAVTLNQGSARFLNNGTFNMLGGTFDQTGEYFIVGVGGSPGTLNQSGGTITTTLSRGWQLSDNTMAESPSVYNLSGGSLVVNSLATWTDANLRNVWFGKGGSNPMYTGGDSGAPGDKFIVTGGTATFTKDINQANSSDVRISRNATIQVSSGTVTFANYDNLIVGFQASNTTQSEILVDGGQLIIQGITNLFLGQADDGKLTINSGSMSLEGFLLLGGDGSGVNDGIGTVTMTGGTLSIGDVFVVNPANSSTFNFSGGLLRISGDHSSILNETWFISSGAPGTVTAIYDSVNNWTDVTVASVPEPSTYVLAVLGLGMLVVVGCRRVARSC
jgi:hypothetical protein